MARKKFDSSENVLEETGKWNVAKSYSDLMIMKLLYECNEYQRICYHGTSDMVDEFIIDNNSKTFSKLLALERYLTTLKLLISNTKYQIKPEYFDKVKGFQVILKILYQYLPSTRIKKIIHRFTDVLEIVEINKSSFDLILNEMIKINEELSDILTKSDMLFYTIQEFDMDDARDEFMKKFENEG